MSQRPARRLARVVTKTEPGSFLIWNKGYRDPAVGNMKMNPLKHTVAVLAMALTFATQAQAEPVEANAPLLGDISFNLPVAACGKFENAIDIDVAWSLANYDKNNPDRNVDCQWLNTRGAKWHVWKIIEHQRDVYNKRPTRFSMRHIPMTTKNSMYCVTTVYLLGPPPREGFECLWTMPYSMSPNPIRSFEHRELE